MARDLPDSLTLPEFARAVVRDGLLASDAKAAQTLEQAQSTRDLLERSGLTGGQLADALAAFHALPRIEFSAFTTAPSLCAKFSQRFLREALIFPFEAPGGVPAIACFDPWAEASIRAAEIVLGQVVTVYIASADDITTALTEYFAGADAAAMAAAGAERAGPAKDSDVESLRDLASGAPVVRAVNELFERAVDARATDLHFEPYRNGLSVRIRVDGLLRTIPAPPASMAAAVISRIKILGGLNIAERRLPQDGSARLRVLSSDIDVRIATMPTPHGETAVIRLLPRERGLVDLARIGLSAADEALLRRLLVLPHGMVVITGPTGSGKTTTLAGALSFLNEPTRKILTIEDPIEYEITGINQSQVKASIGLTFATALRSFVRQDPDVIMVGEIRDAETAHIAIHAALTGHLVLTTLHTETAAAAVPRLLDLGVENFLLQSTLRGVVAQRLVRILCDYCKRPTVLDPEQLAADPRFAAVGLRAGDTVWQPCGCERCGGMGYKGRQGIFEILDVTDPVRQAISRDSDASRIEAPARATGMTTMLDDAIVKCRSGRTSVSEVLRVTTLR